MRREDRTLHNPCKLIILFGHLLHVKNPFSAKGDLPSPATSRVCTPCGLTRSLKLNFHDWNHMSAIRYRNRSITVSLSGIVSLAEGKYMMLSHDNHIIFPFLINYHLDRCTTIYGWFDVLIITAGVLYIIKKASHLSFFPQLASKTAQFRVYRQ